MNQLPTEAMQLQFLSWRVMGRVATLRGTPVAGARIEVNIGLQQRKLIQTDPHGVFQTEFSLNRDMYPHLRVRVTVTKTGYHTAYETVEIPSNDQTWPIDVILREKKEDAVEPALPSLVASLAPKLLATAAQDKDIDPGRREFRHGTEKFVTQRKSLEALPDLEKVVERWPNCAECRALLGLAEIDAGSWTSGIREANRAFDLGKSRPQEARLAAPLVILGAVEEWRGRPDMAAAFLGQALLAEPEDPLALQEMGRTLVEQFRWQDAIEHLEKAIKNGASPQARLLLAHAQFELGKNEDAEGELARFRAQQKTKPSAAARLAYAKLQQQLKLEAQNKIVPLVSASLPEIQKAMPELQGVEAASNQDHLPEILRKTGENVDLFFRTLPNTISQEHVLQERLAEDGKVSNSLDQNFQYVILVQTGKPEFHVKEYRGDSRGRAVAVQNPEGKFMLTTGFTSLSLTFHPTFQPHSDFRLLGRQRALGRNAYVVAFAQTLQEIHILEQFSVGPTAVLILQQGVAWIDAETFQVLRMRTDLLKPQPELLLTRQTTEVTYDKVQFKVESVPLWLPREVAVTVEMRDRNWHNLHRYSDFKLFRVETSETISPPKGGSAPFTDTD